MDKRKARLKRARGVRIKIRAQGERRLCVHRTPRHIYAQITESDGGRVLVCASTVDGEVKKSVSYGGNIDAAKVVGRVVAERAKKAGIERVAFDRSGYRYHGRVKALADSAREAGLKF
ncbi:MAG: 50S ribosomal protein L18 [Gammaproteobacteria bacterium]|nr:50S ribosomal protein L18 [Gammaproteobacteria bacterium]